MEAEADNSMWRIYCLIGCFNGNLLRRGHVCWVRRGTQRVDAQLPNADGLVGTGYQLQLVICASDGLTGRLSLK